LLADYPLQSNWMARNKRRPHVLIAHVAIHFLVLLLLAGEARRLIWPYLLALALAHLCIDVGKNTVNRLRPGWVIAPYVVDQLIHYATIALTGAWITRALGTVAPPFSPELAILACAYLAATYVWFISERILAYADDSYRREVQAQVWPRMGMRAVMLTALLWLGGLSTVPLILSGAVVSVPYLSGKHRQRALLTDLSVSLVIAIFAGLALWR
jgi:hypothetical protein